MKNADFSLNLAVGFGNSFVQQERKFPNILVHQFVMRFGHAQLLAQFDNFGSEFHGEQAKLLFQLQFEFRGIIETTFDEIDNFLQVRIGQVRADVDAFLSDVYAN